MCFLSQLPSWEILLQTWRRRGTKHLWEGSCFFRLCRQAVRRLCCPSLSLGHQVPVSRDPGAGDTLPDRQPYRQSCCVVVALSEEGEGEFLSVLLQKALTEDATHGSGSRTSIRLSQPSFHIHLIINTTTLHDKG